MIDPTVSRHVAASSNHRRWLAGGVLQLRRRRAIAVMTQQGMAKRNEDVPAEKRIDMRIGIHVGDIIIEEATTSSATASTLRRGSKASRSPAAFRFPRMPGGRCRAR